jgi:hypothetical protein
MGIGAHAKKKQIYEIKNKGLSNANKKQKKDEQHNYKACAWLLKIIN